MIIARLFVAIVTHHPMLWRKCPEGTNDHSLDVVIAAPFFCHDGNVPQGLMIIARLFAAIVTPHPMLWRKCPVGTNDNSPAIHCRDLINRKTTPSRRDG